MPAKKKTGNKNGQTFEDSEQSDDEELAEMLEDLGNMAIVSTCSAGAAAGSTAGGTAAGTSPFPSISQSAYYTFGNVFKTGGYLLKYNPINQGNDYGRQDFLCGRSGDSHCQLKLYQSDCAVFKAL